VAQFPYGIMENKASNGYYHTGQIFKKSISMNHPRGLARYMHHFSSIYVCVCVRVYVPACMDV